LRKSNYTAKNDFTFTLYIGKSVGMNNIKKALDERGISVMQAAKAGLPYMSVYKQYNGERNPSGRFALMYERVLGIPRSEIRPDLWSPEENPASKLEQGDADGGTHA
jgi:hypothetical protein